MRALWQHGPQAAWLAISAHAQGLRAQALDLVQQQVLGVAAKAVPLFLASLAVPGGAFLQLARGLYNGVMLFVEKGRQIAQVGQALFASAAAIAAGQLAPAALAVENTLVKILPVALAFLARQLGLDGLSGAIQTGLKKVQAPVEKAVNKVLDTVADKANAIWGALQTGANKVVEKGQSVVTTISDKVANWLRLRKPFSVGSEQHTLFFDSQATQPQLMVASDPQSYHQFLLRLPTTPNLRSTKQQAATIAQRIDGLLSQTAGSYGIDRTSKIEALLNQLAPLTILLMQQGGNAIVADTPPDFAGLTSGGFGRGMRIAYLATKTSTGSEASATGNDVYDTLNKRRSGNGSYYVRGHLLSSHHNGTGADWRNLTPLSRSGNSLHETRVESELWKAISDPPARAFLYTVTPTYGRAVRRDLLQKLAHSTDPAKDVKAAIITAEQHVPLSLVCIIQEVDAATRQPKGSPLQITVPNVIEQTAITDYQITATVTPLELSVARAEQLETLQIPSKQAAEIVKQTINGTIFRNREQLLAAIPGLSKNLIDSLYIPGQIAFK